jgi:hypothetical protein
VLEPCTLAGGIRAQCGTFEVPENRARPNGRTIALDLAVLPARGGAPRDDPVVHIAGGPGESTIANDESATALPGG